MHCERTSTWIAAILFGIGAVLASSLPASAQGFPEAGRPIQIIVPYPPGGGSDIAMRLLAPALEKELGTTIEIVNKAGAGSQVGMSYVANSKPDGYTIGYGLWPALIAIYLDPSRQANFDGSSFVPVAMHTIDPTVLAVAKDSPFQSLKDMVDAANSGKSVTLGVIGQLSADHLAVLKLMREAGTEFSTVIFKGAAPGITALLGGHIDALKAGIVPVRPHLEAGDMRALAIFDATNERLPGVPTVRDEGYDVVLSNTRGFVVPKGTPADVVDALAKAFEAAINSDEHQAALAANKMKSLYMGPEEFSEYIAQTETEIEPLLDLALQQLRQ